MFCLCGTGSSVGMATDHGLDGPGTDPSEDEILHSLRSALLNTQPNLKWVLGVPGLK